MKMNRALILSTAIAAVMTALPAMPARALDGAWKTAVSGTWSTAARWQGSNIADGSDATADFSKNDLISDLTVTLDTSRTVGALVFGDTNFAATPFNWTLSGSTPAQILTLNSTVAGNTPTITVSSGNATISVVLDGTEGMQKKSTGTLILTAANTYAGSTTISAGVLQIGANGTTGSLAAGGIIDKGVLAFNRTDAYLFTNDISSSGSLNQFGSGTVILTGNNSYAGPTTVAAGTLQIGNAGSTGTLGAGAVINNSVLAFNHTDNITVTNDISGSGALNQNGAGNLILTGSGSYAGQTTISAGTLQVGKNGTTGTLGAGSVIDNSTLAFKRTDAFSVTNDISGTGGLIQNSSGTLFLLGHLTYAGITTITNGTLQVGNNDTTGSLSPAGIINNNALTFNRTDTLVVSDDISGTGSLNQFGTGSIILTGSNSYSGQTTISAGTLQIGNGGTTGTLGTGSVLDNSILAFNHTDNLTVTNDISGSGVLNQLGTGTTQLTGNNTYAGLTTISAGTLQIGKNGTTGTLGTADVLDNGTLAFRRTDVITVTNNISGSGQLVKMGAGTLILAGVNSYTGQTTISNGTLQIGDNDTNGSLGTGSVINNSIFAFNRTDVFVVANDISGTGSLNQLGSGSVVLTGNNSYTGTTSILSGTLQIGNGGTTGTLGTGTVIDNAALAFNRSDNLTVSNDISGPGVLNQVGSGNLILTGNNSYAGPTTITNGTLQVGKNGTIGTLGTGSVIDNSVLAFKRTDAFVVTNDISGTGGLIQNGAGTLFLLGNLTYAGGTTISAGTLQIGNNDTTGSLAPGSIINNSILAFNRTDALVVANLISGTGSLNQFGSGSIILTGSNSYSGQTTITAGVLQIGNNGSTGSLGTGTVLNNSILAFNRTDTITLPNVITGTGDLQQLGSGSLVLTGNNNYAGQTLIAAGTLRVGSNGTTGTLGTGNVIDNGILAFRRTDLLAVPNDISGAGQFEKRGAGTVILTGNNTYAGATSVLNGTLQIGNNGTAGSLGAADIIDNATLSFYHSDSLTLPNNISGTGSLQQLGSATLVLTGSNSYLGGTTIAAGIVQIGNGGTTGSLGAGSVINNSALAFNRSDVLTVGNDISGSGSLNQLASSTVILTGNNSYAGTTTVSAGTLQIGNNGTTGSLGAGDVITNASLAFNRTDTITVANNISGTGGLQQLGSATLILNGSNSYTDPTTVSAGTLANGVDNAVPTASPLTVTLGATFDLNGHAQSLPSALGTGTVTNSSATAATLTINNTPDDISPVQFIGNLGITKAGPGNYTLSGPLSYSGITTISADTLIVSGAGNSIGAVTGPGAFVVGTPATLISDGVTASSWTVNGGHTIRANTGNAGTSRVNSLVIAQTSGTYTGTLDVTNSHVIIQSVDSSSKLTAVATLVSEITSGKHGGDWLGTGITSSTVALNNSGTNSHNETLALVDAAELFSATNGVGTFGGQPTDSNSLLVTAALIGDADLNGIVDFNDLVTVAHHFNQTGLGWANGNFDLTDGSNIVDFNDLVAVAHHFNQTFALEAGLSTQNSGPTSVPEPTSLALFVIGGMLLTRRNARK